MGVFGRGKENPSAHTLGAALRYNRRLRSDLDARQTIKLLEDLLSTYRQRQYAHLAHVIPAGFRIADGTPVPERFVEFQDARREVFFLALWEDRTMALFALAQEDLDNTQLIGHWKMRDRSLTSVGQLAPNTVGLGAPQVPPEYLEEILQAFGKPASPGNLTHMAGELGALFLIKAAQYMEQGLKIPSKPFIDSHSPVTCARELQSILDDLGSNLQLLPYIQDLPLRIRAIVLESPDDYAGIKALPDR